MDAAFLLDEPMKSQLFRSIMHALGCVYASLWSFFPQPSICLISLDGYYNEDENQPSSSSRSLARKLFEEYRQSIISIEDRHVPGLAFTNNRPYVELIRPDILRLAYSDTQRLFYEESQIQKVVFMGCKKGEIELGFSHNFPQINLELGLREWFPEDLLPKPRIQPEGPPLSSSSSSLKSLDSPNNISDFSPNIFSNIINPITSHKSLEPPCFTQQPYLSIIHGHQSLREREEEEAMARAILAVLTSPSATSSSSSSSHQNVLNPKASAFKKYYGSGAGKAVVGLSCLRKESMIKRATAYYQRLNRFRRERQGTAAVGSGGGGGGGGGGGPTTTQLHHMLSERKRREKLNESIQALRMLLPQGTKKDKASVLNAAREQLLSLQTEINKLIERNREMEAKLDGEREFERLSFDQRFHVQVIHALETTSRERIVDLRVVFRRESIRVDDLVVRLLEFLKSDRNASVISIEARTQTQEETLVSSSGVVTLRLKFEGEWDESAFVEAVRRVVGDMPN